MAPPPPPRGSAATLQGAVFETALAQRGLTPPMSGFAASPGAAAEVASGIGFPVALKIVSAQISHKTEVGGVRLNLKSRAEVEREAAALAAAVRKIAPPAHLDGFTVQEMVGGIEVIVGARPDPLFGPMIAVGAGGTLGQVVRCVGFRLL